MDWNRVVTFVQRRFHENRSSRAMRQDIERLKLKREEKDLLIELEQAEVLKKKELDTIIRLMDQVGAGGTQDDFLGRIQQARTIRERMREALKDIIDVDEARDIKHSFSARIRAVLRGEK